MLQVDVGFVRRGVAMFRDNVSKDEDYLVLQTGLADWQLTLSLANTSNPVPRPCIFQDCSFVDNESNPISTTLVYFATFENLATR